MHAHGPKRQLEVCNHVMQSGRKWKAQPALQITAHFAGAGEVCISGSCGILKRCRPAALCKGAQGGGLNLQRKADALLPLQGLRLGWCV